jgi:hypothetical protein
MNVQHPTSNAQRPIVDEAIFMILGARRAVPLKQNMFVKFFKKPAPAKRGVLPPAGSPDAKIIEN